jgi:hypothetical protein
MTPSRIPWRSSRSLVAAIVVVVLAALAAPAEGRTFVFSALFVGNPDDYGDPNERPVGTLTLLVTQGVGNPEDFVAIGTAYLTRPLAEPYTEVQITDRTGAVVLGMDDPEGLPGGVTVFSSETLIPAAIVARMVGDPDQFLVTAFTALGPVATGQLQFRGPLERK